MSKYLDETGLSHFWGKIKAYLTRNHLEPLQVKEYIDVTAPGNSDPTGYLYFAKLCPDNNDWTKPIYVKYRVIADIPNVSNKRGYRDATLELYMYNSTVLWYKNKNAYVNSSYYPYYDHEIYRATTEGLTSGYGHLIGLRFQSSYSPTSASYKRTIRFEVLETLNCSVTFFDSGILYASAPGTGSTNYAGRSAYGGTSQGDVHTGDANDMNYYNREYHCATKYKTYSGRYQILLTTRDQKLLPINTTNNNVTTSKTLTEEPFDPFGDIFYSATTTTYNAGASLSSSSYLYRQYPCDLRYSFNCGGYDAAGDLVGNTPLYLVCTPLSDGTAKLYSSPLSQSLPSTEDGRLYIYLGNVYNDTYPYRVGLHINHPVYMYKNGAVREVSGYSDYAGDSTTVNGHTVAKDVPSDAVFTDTTYSNATTSADGLMSSTDKTKLDGVATGAEVNQNAFGSFSFGYSSGGAPVLDTIDASSKTDSLTFTAGVNIGFLVDEANKAVTISATDTTYSTMSSSDIVTGTSTTTMVATPKAIHDAIESMINTALANVLTVTTS